MTRPGTVVTVQDTPSPRSAPTDTGVWFAAGLSDRGALEPILIRSMNEFIRLLGDRVSYSILYDSLDTFFREGGAACYVSRVVGPSAVQATRNLLDGVPATALVVKANSVGAWGNSLKVGVVAGGGGGTYQIKVTDSADVVLEQSPDLTTQQDAVTWSQGSAYVVITIGGGTVPPVVAAPAALSTGTDDRSNITDAHWLAALDRFTMDLGPGNVSAPGQTSDVRHTQLNDHAEANQRPAFLDYPDTPTEATLTTSATNAKSTGSGQYGGGFAPWVKVPGVLAGTTRTVPPSAAAAGAAARVDASHNPNTPAAGLLGVLRYAVGLSQPNWDDPTRERLNNAGVNVIRSMFGGFRIYGWRSLANPVTNPNWLDLSNVRYLMGLAARCRASGESYVFMPIDGFGHTLAQYQGSLTALCQADWVDGQIFGLTATDAFNVDVGSNVNTPETIAANELRAVVSVRPSPDAELVSITIVNVPVTEAVS
jgi:phage tail sheath protein FI